MVRAVDIDEKRSSLVSDAECHNRTVRHAKVYTVLLALLAGTGLFVAATILLFLLPVAREKGASVLTYNIGIVLYSFVSMFLVVTVACRRKKPTAGRILSKIANVLIMYPFFPVGVVVGLYGFWKVDRRR